MKKNFAVLFFAIIFSLYINPVYSQYKFGQNFEQEDSEEEDLEITQNLWEEVKTATQKKLPKTAREKLIKIFDYAIENNKLDEVIKAKYHLIALNMTEKANGAKTSKDAQIIFLSEYEKELKQSDEKLKPFLKLMLANWYWSYYLNNKSRISKRTRTADYSDKDFSTWDLPKLFNEINKCYQELLSNEDELKNIHISELKSILNYGNLPISLRPSLFDFFCHKALEFYCNDVNNKQKPVDSFEIDNNSPALKDYDEFAKWQPQTSDNESQSFNAVKVFQRLLKHNLENNNINGFIDNEILRLKWAYSVAVGSGTSDIYIKSLENLANKYPKNELSGIALANISKEYYNVGDYIKSLYYVDEIYSRFYRKNHYVECVNEAQNIKSDILEKKLNIQIEKIVAPGKAQAKLQYKNITKLYFRLYERPEEQLTVKYPERVNYNEIQSKNPIKEWSIDLEPTNDYKEKDIFVDLPIYDIGIYYLITSLKENFPSLNNSNITVNELTVSKLNFFHRTNSIGEKNEVIVVDNVSGKPQKNVNVSAYKYDHQKQDWIELDNGLTDEKGFFLYKTEKTERYNNKILIKARLNNDLVFSYIPLNLNYFSPFSSGINTVIFTDRSIYRPGQTIFFKGINYSYNTKENEYNTCKENQPVNVILNDQTGRIIQTLTLTTNKFGSFNGSFIVPENRIPGKYSILSSTTIINENGSSIKYRGRTSISIEEYKRPKFKVELSKPKSEFKLYDKVLLEGSAIGYNGAYIDEGIVKYRVVRKVIYPVWRCWWSWIPPISDSIEICNGTTTTDNNGKFNIQFIAIPDKKTDPATDPIFSYEIFADVTDKNGETRSTSIAIKLAYNSVNLKIDCSNECEENAPFDFIINTTNLNDEPLSLNGSLEIYSLIQPDKPAPKTYYTDSFALKSDQSNPRNWKVNKHIKSIPFITNADGSVKISCNSLKEGAYKLVAIINDKDNKEVKSEHVILSINSKSEKFNIKIPFYTKLNSSLLQPGDTYEGIWATGYDEGPALIEVEHKGNILQSYWTSKSNKTKISIPITSDMLGGFCIRITQFKDNREYTISENIPVEWEQKKLNLKFSKFHSKLQPGQEEIWQIEVTGKEAEKDAIELLATMYDASLDLLKSHKWINKFDVFYKNTIKIKNMFINTTSEQKLSASGFPSTNTNVRIYPEINDEIRKKIFTIFGNYSVPGIRPPIVMRAMKATTSSENQTQKEELAEDISNNIDLSQISARKDFKETAFFYPNLLIKDNNSVVIEFKIPESLTTWKFMCFAHGTSLQSGNLTAETITQKDLMIEPFTPRFIREGDKLEFITKITNQTEEKQKGKISLIISEPTSDKPLNKEFRINAEKEFMVEPKKSSTVSWLINVPNMAGLVKYKVVGSTGILSDGEEGWLPILSKRVFLTESIPMPINGPMIKSFNFDKLIDSKNSSSIKHKSLTLEVTSNPAWYAIQALPYLMEYPYECSEQLFNKYYANMLAFHIANSDPRIKDVFESWKNINNFDKNSLLSSLEKNQELKNLTLQETPWLISAEKEANQKYRLGLLFDENKIKEESEKAIKKLKERQNSDGGFAWFPGGKSNDFITLYIATGLARIKNLGINIDKGIITKAMPYLDRMIVKRYEESLKYDQKFIFPCDALYLYCRSFCLKDYPADKTVNSAIDHFTNLAEEFWYKQSRMTQAHIALGLNRMGRKQSLKTIINSLLERSSYDEEMGRFWKDNEFSLSWFRADIETQAMMIEVFSELLKDEKIVDECKIWLIKQKQTQNWKSTKATADAIYSLIFRGTDILSSNKLVTAEVGNFEVTPQKAETGTGYYKKTWTNKEINPEMGKIILNKQEKGIAWGAMHWQYFEDIDKVTTHESNLKLEKALFVKRNTNKGPTLFEVKDGKLKVGDLVTVRINLRTDRDLEFVHMKDSRGSGMEPINVLSSTKYQDGLSYYEVTKDTATSFFIDYLPKGTYVFEYDLRVQHAGTYQSGLAEIQSMYAPEFNSHSNSIMLKVTK